MPVGGLLVGVSDSEHRRLVEGPGYDLQADGQLLTVGLDEATGHGGAGESGDVDR